MLAKINKILKNEFSNCNCFSLFHVGESARLSLPRFRAARSKFQTCRAEPNFVPLSRILVDVALPNVREVKIHCPLWVCDCLAATIASTQSYRASVLGPPASRPRRRNLGQRRWRGRTILGR